MLLDDFHVRCIAEQQRVNALKLLLTCEEECWHGEPVDEVYHVGPCPVGEFGDFVVEFDE